ncbi:MAG: aromatic ring-hydroxylating dioxygenase subunit alpha [Pseudomonadota bacterium]
MSVSIPGLDPESDCLREPQPTLPARWYFDAQCYQRELSTIWRRHWLYLCRSDAIAKPRQFVSHTIGDQKIFVVRTAKGVLSGYFNTCRHRGSLLIEDEQGRLDSSTVVCPYHRWCYASDDGALLRTSSKFEPPGFDKQSFGLHRIAVVEWRGFVFINLDAEAQWPEESIFLRGAERIRNFPLENLVVGHRYVKRMACNWKTFWDNFNECLHCPNVHPGLTDLVPVYRQGVLSPRDVPNWQDKKSKQGSEVWENLRAGAQTWTMDGDTQGYRFDSLNEEELARGHTYAVTLPGTFLGCHADHVRIARITPTGPEETEIAIEWLVIKEALQDPHYDLANVYEFGIQVLEEDCAVAELNQRGMHAAPFDQGVLMPEEYYVKAFQDWVRDALDVDDAGASEERRNE